MSDEATATPVEEAPASVIEEKALPRPFPRIGNGVHYVRDDYSHLEDGLPGGEHIPAGVIAVFEDGSVTLAVDGATVSPVGFDEGGALGTWHWPEKE